MAVVARGHRRTLTSVQSICGAKVVGADGEPLGRIEELMIEAGDGRIAYAALAHGGILGVGEKLFAISWACFTVDPVEDRFKLPLTDADLADRDGFDKDAWPDAPDDELAAHCGRDR